MFLLTLVLTWYEYNCFNCEPYVEGMDCDYRFGRWIIRAGFTDTGNCTSDRCCCDCQITEITDPPPPRTPTPTLKLPESHVKKKPSGKFLIAIYMARFE